MLCGAALEARLKAPGQFKGRAGRKSRSMLQLWCAPKHVLRQAMDGRWLDARNFPALERLC
jgi:hypothetical protein